MPYGGPNARRLCRVWPVGVPFHWEEGVTLPSVCKANLPCLRLGGDLPGFVKRLADNTFFFFNKLSCPFHIGSVLERPGSV